jgi:hypothetical protein
MPIGYPNEEALFMVEQIALRRRHPHRNTPANWHALKQWPPMIRALLSTSGRFYQSHPHNIRANAKNFTTDFFYDLRALRTTSRHRSCHR